MMGWLWLWFVKWLWVFGGGLAGLVEEFLGGWGLGKGGTV